MATKRDLPAAETPSPLLVLAIRERTETVDCGDYDEVYAGNTVTLWVNAPDRLADGALSLGTVLAQVIKGWTLQTTDGQPAPISPEAFAALPTELVEWLYFQWQQRRHAPLAKLNSNWKRADTPPIETLNGTPLKAG